MQENNELNDIILNKGNNSSSNKKVVLAVATLGVVLIIVVMLMNTINSNDGENLPKPVPLPTPQSISEQTMDEAPQEEPLFEEVDVVQEKVSDENNLDKIAQKLKQESMAEAAQGTQAVDEPVSEPEQKEAVQPTKVQEPKKVAQPTPTAKKEASTGMQYFVQVGSFSRYKPNKKFLDSIKAKGFKYEFYKVGELNKVLIGPFANEKKARSALRTIRGSIEAGAFLTKK